MTEVAEAATNGKTPHPARKNGPGVRYREPGKVVEAAELHAQGVSYSEIARRLGVSKPTVIRWVTEGVAPEVAGQLPPDAAEPSVKTEVAGMVSTGTRRALQQSVLGVLVLVGVIASVLSWDALVALGRAAALDANLALLYPACVDALAATSAVAVVLLQPHGWRVRAYPALILATFVVLSTAGNGIHAWTRGGRLVLPQGVAVVVSAVPPVTVAAVVYLLLLLLRPVPERK